MKLILMNNTYEKSEHHGAPKIKYGEAHRLFEI